jgi:hypothetical protein
LVMRISVEGLLNEYLLVLLLFWHFSRLLGKSAYRHAADMELWNVTFRLRVEESRTLHRPDYDSDRMMHSTQRIWKCVG